MIKNNVLSDFLLHTLLVLLLCFALPQSVGAEYTCLDRVTSKETLLNEGFVERVEYQDAPWMVNLSKGAYPICGGVLINTDLVVTAAHCMTTFEDKTITVRTAGVNGSPFGDRKLQSKRFISHPCFDADTGQFDVALVLLDGEIDVDYKARDLFILEPQFEAYWAAENNCAKVMGWGRTRESAPGSDTLLATNVPIWSNEQCANKYGETRVSSQSICAGYGEGEYDSCEGDSGGPLLVQTKWGDWLVGVVSSGRGCGRPNLPGIYTRFSDERIYNWIFETAKLLRSGANIPELCPE